MKVYTCFIDRSFKRMKSSTLKANSLFYLGLLAIVAIGTGCSDTVTHRSHQSYTIEIKEMQFQPAVLTLRAGDTVVFINRDFVTHDVTGQIAGGWTPSPIDPGDMWSMVVDKTIDYFCSFHPVMKGRITTE